MLHWACSMMVVLSTSYHSCPLVMQSNKALLAYLVNFKIYILISSNLIMNSSKNGRRTGPFRKVIRVRVKTISHKSLKNLTKVHQLGLPSFRSFFVSTMGNKCRTLEKNLSGTPRLISIQCVTSVTNMLICKWPTTEGVNFMVNHETECTLLNSWSSQS